jgi:putative addiction module CopG family antidote
MNITLTPKLRQSIERRVRSGLYGDASEVVRAGIRALQREEMGAVWVDWQQARAELPQEFTTPAIEQRVESRIRVLRRKHDGRK